MATVADKLIDRVVDTAGSLSGRTEAQRRAFADRAKGTRRRTQRLLAHRLAHLGGRIQGAASWLEHLGMDERVPDDVLVQRVRSKLGPLYRRYDVPRMHVGVTEGVVSLHGVVRDERQRVAFERAVERMSGVRGVRSYLFTGLLPGETPPSEGGRPPMSEAKRNLLGAVRALDVGDDEEVERLTGTVLATFCEMIPEGEREHVNQHLPQDVRALCRIPRRIGLPERPRTPGNLFQEVAEGAGRTIGTAEQATRAVLDELRRLVPEEINDVRAVLPAELKELWDAPVGV